METCFITYDLKRQLPTSMTGLCQKSRRFDTSGAFTNQPVNRSLCLLHLGRSSKRKEQHLWRRREGERGTDGVLDTGGRRHKTDRPGSERAKISARSRSSESQAESRRVSRGVVDAGENDHQHGKHSRLQAQAGMKLGVNNDVNLGTKKSALQLMDGGGIKNKPAQQPPLKPDTQSGNGCTAENLSAKRKSFRRSLSKNSFNSAA